MKIATAIAAGLLASGCAAAALNAANEQLAKDKALCQSMPKTTNVAMARCINIAEEKAYRASGVGGGDLVAVRLATRMAIAEKMDKGQMSLAEGELEFAKVNSSLIGTDQQRRNSAVTANAMNSLANPGPTTCTRIGNSVTCY